ncbi:hypothetical protein [Bacteroides heparinolyticus]|uniref:hypothetical protein n=1 Tax=Prevotella heparinolytica TaxID=28113 RepID=UPI0035A14EFF
MGQLCSSAKVRRNPPERLFDSLFGLCAWKAQIKKRAASGRCAGQRADKAPFICA